MRIVPRNMCTKFHFKIMKDFCYEVRLKFCADEANNNNNTKGFTIARLFSLKNRRAKKNLKMSILLLPQYIQLNLIIVLLFDKIFSKSSAAYLMLVATD